MYYHVKSVGGGGTSKPLDFPVYSSRQFQQTCKFDCEYCRLPSHSNKRTDLGPLNVATTKRTCTHPTLSITRTSRLELTFAGWFASPKCSSPTADLLSQIFSEGLVSGWLYEFLTVQYTAPSRVQSYHYVKGTVQFELKSPQPALWWVHDKSESDSLRRKA